MVGNALVGIAGPVTPGLHAKVQPLAVEPRLEPVKRVGMTDRFADDRKVVGVTRRHGAEHGFDGVKRRIFGHQVTNRGFRHDPHVLSSTGRGRHRPGSFILG